MDDRERIEHLESKIVLLQELINSQRQLIDILRIRLGEPITRPKNHLMKVIYKTS